MEGTDVGTIRLGTDDPLDLFSERRGSKKGRLDMRSEADFCDPNLVHVQWCCKRTRISRAPIPDKRRCHSAERTLFTRITHCTQEQNYNQKEFVQKLKVATSYITTSGTLNNHFGVNVKRKLALSRSSKGAKQCQVKKPIRFTKQFQQGLRPSL
jgi:hypothetical protein